jgi:hypothetical protein
MTGHAQPVLDSANGHDYQVIAASEISWDTANAAASGLTYQGNLGHLVTPTGEAENTFVSGLLNFPGLSYCAGGFQDPNNPASLTDPKAGWTWLHNEGAIPTNNAGPGFAHWGAYATGIEPNDNGGPGSEQCLALISCATARQFPGGWGDYTNVTPSAVIWNDEGGDGGQVAGCVVEVEQVPEQVPVVVLILFQRTKTKQPESPL